VKLAENVGLGIIAPPIPLLSNDYIGFSILSVSLVTCVVTLRLDARSTDCEANEWLQLGCRDTASSVIS